MRKFWSLLLSWVSHLNPLSEMTKWHPTSLSLTRKWCSKEKDGRISKQQRDQKYIWSDLILELFKVGEIGLLFYLSSFKNWTAILALYFCGHTVWMQADSHRPLPLLLQDTRLGKKESTQRVRGVKNTYRYDKGEGDEYNYFSFFTWLNNNYNNLVRVRLISLNMVIEKPY